MIEVAEFDGKWILKRLTKQDPNVSELEYWGDGRWLFQPELARQFTTHVEAEGVAQTLGA
jgi:hypothetical protein